MAGTKKITLTSNEMAYVLGTNSSNMKLWVDRMDNPMPCLGKDTTRRGKPVMYDPQAVVKWRIEEKIRQRIAGTGGHNQVQAGSGAVEDNVVDFHREKTRLTTAQADKQELEVRIRAGELAPVSVFGEAVDVLCQILSSALSSIPAELQRVAPHLAASDIDVVRRVIAKAQNALAEQEIDFTGLGKESGTGS